MRISARFCAVIRILTRLLLYRYNRQGYINSLSRLIEEKLQKFDDPSSAHVFFSAHGLPVKYVETLGDPYQTQTEATVDFCMARLRALGYTNSHTLAYQSRLGPVQWLQPYTDEKIRELGAAGTTKMVVVPVSFVSEHIETLEEIDMVYAELAAECGVTQWERVPTIGLDGEFIDDLASAVIEALPKMDEQPLQEINEGRPVSLRVVNDLVQLKSKDTLALFDEFGPIRYNAPQRVGFTTRAELINGRIAMVAITAASALSISQGNFWDRVLDGALPFQFW